MSRSNDSAAQQPELVEVVLEKTHTHMGQSLKAGAKISVTAAQKTWLESRGVVGIQQEETSNV
ncbi:hypothetical protein [Pseudomonas boanensis]|uniref:DUF7210 family protein n=1 Tax=Metapseudomonas boanensis TaxID=2822138 RepID=UPI0035D42A10